nr:MAG TPA: hypothetical protein [Caudoviricetes sp.]
MPIGFILVAVLKTEQEKAIFEIVNFFRFKIWQENYPRGVKIALQNLRRVKKG